MARRPHDPHTLDLLSWTPPEPTRAFAREDIRAASLRSMVAKAVSLALKECGKSREEVAEEIGAYLGEPCSKPMLDAYASEAREDHVVNVVRFLALIHATGDQRLLQMLAEPFGWAVIDQKYLPAIEDAMLDAKIDELTQRRQLARKRWRG
ncbi:hypothetical protein [Azospirillum halopraeferens]|uniref:hypothetical protein n=1 Tax=Azospirillum halopraeferens TaxID=34010 RepID=UPI0003FCCC0D|nr:hypothetical protein [Azospirillum halopraeferens]